MTEPSRRRKVLGVIVSASALLLLLFITTIGMELHNSSFSMNHRQQKNILRKLKSVNSVVAAAADPKTVVSKKEENEGKKNTNDDILLNDIDPALIACGHWKCFARSMSDPRKGYQLMRNGDVEHYRDKLALKKKSPTASKLQRLFNFAHCLEEEYNIPHLVGGNPIRQIDLTKEDNLIRKIQYPKNWGFHFVKRKKKLFHPGKVLVLPVKYNENAIQFAIHETTNTSKLEGHIQKSILSNQFPDYYDNFVTSIQRLNTTISEEGVGCLVIDFQAMLDDNGIVYLFDIDPCIGSAKIITTPPSKNCKGIDPERWDHSYNPILRNQQIIPFQQKIANLVDAARTAENQRLLQKYDS